MEMQSGSQFNVGRGLRGEARQAADGHSRVMRRLWFISFRCFEVNFHSFDFAMLRCLRFSKKIKVSFLEGYYFLVRKRTTLKITNQGRFSSVGMGKH